MKIWDSYTQLIKRNCANKPDAKKELSYWRNNLFAGIIIYLLPFSLVALIPSLYFVTFVIKNYGITLLDLFTLFSILFIAFMPSIAINLRKIIFIVVVYLFSGMVLYYTGIYGGGFLYLQAISVLFFLIFPSRYAYWTVFINIIICLFFGCVLAWGYLPWPRNGQPTLGSWVVVSSNLIFLNLLEAALIPRLFIGLQQTIEKETQLQLQSNNQQKMLEQNLQMLELKNNELEQFAYIASHDLQEPLRMVTSFLHQLEKKYGDSIDDKGKQYIYFAVDGAKRMRQIILDLLEFSRIGRVNNETEEVNINDLLSDVLMVLNHQIEDSKATIVVEKLPITNSYKIPLSQVFQNLISNAIKYHHSERAPVISISCKEISGYWLFSVEDNGIGINEQNFEKIFIIFQRLHNKDQYSGSGIGLAIVKKIIDNLAGKIWLDSQEGKGSVFYFTLPK